MTSQFKHICDVIIMRKVFLLGVEDLFQSTHPRRFGFVFRNLDIFLTDVLKFVKKDGKMIG